MSEKDVTLQKLIDLINKVEHGQAYKFNGREDVRECAIQLIKEGYPLELSSKDKYILRKIPHEHLNNCSKCSDKMANKDTYIYGKVFLCKKCWDKVKYTIYK